MIAIFLFHKFVNFFNSPEYNMIIRDICEEKHYGYHHRNILRVFILFYKNVQWEGGIHNY